MLGKDRVDFRRSAVETVLQVVQQITYRQIGLAHQDVVKRRVRPHRLPRDRRHMGAEGNGLGPARSGQEATVHVVFKSGRCDLGQIVLRLILIDELAELRPAHSLGIRVDHLDLVHGMEQGGHLSQGDLRPDHVLSRTPPHTMLRANPQPAVRGGGVHQHDIDRLLIARRVQEAMIDDIIGIGEIGLSQLGHTSRAQIFF